MQYGLPLLFVVILVGAFAVPLPTNLLVVASGSFVEQGQMNLTSLVLVLMFSSLLGDNLGFGLGRWGGRHWVAKLTDRFGGQARLAQAVELSRRWGGAGIFLTRWLLGAPAPWVNVACGLTGYSWPRFLFWEFLGQSLWVLIYVSLGYVFSDRVQAVGDLLGNISGVLLGLALTLLLGWRVWGYFYPAPVVEEPLSPGEPAVLMEARLT